MKKKPEIGATSIDKEDVISESRPTFKDPDVDISFRSKLLTEEDWREISEFIAKEKKRLQQKAKIASA